MKRANIIAWLMLLSIVAFSQQTYQLVFNQPYYAPGDTAYFSLRTQNDNPVGSNGVLSMSLFDVTNHLLSIRFKVNNGIGQNQFVVPKNLKSGGYQVVIFNQDLTTLLQTGFAVGGPLQSEDQSQLKIEINTEKLQTTRSSSKVDFSLVDDNGKPLNGKFTISVMNASVLSGELLSVNVQKEVSIPNRMILEGQLIDRASQRPLPDSTQMMLYFQKSRLRYLTSVRTNGYFRSEILDYYGEDELFLIAETPDGSIVSDLEVVWENGLPTPSSKPQIIGSNDKKYADFIQKKRLIDESYGFYIKRDSLLIKTSTGSRLDVIEPDYRVKPRDYVLFDNLGKFIQNIVDPLYFKETEEGGVMRVRFLKPYPATASPLYVINGVVTLDTEYFLSLDQDDIEELNVVMDYRKLVRFGLLGKNGIVIVKTRYGEEKPPIDQNKLLTGLNRPIVPSQQEEELGNPIRPDFRACIHYRANVAVRNGQASIEYKNSDDLGPVVIQVKGLTENGQPFSGHFKYEVILKSQ